MKNTTTKKLATKKTFQSKITRTETEQNEQKKTT